MHDAFTIGVPTLFVLFGILLNRYDYKWLEESLRTEIKELRKEMIARFDRVDDDLRRFYSITGEHEGLISLLEKLRDR